MTYKELIKLREFCKERGRRPYYIIDEYIDMLTPFMDQAMNNFNNRVKTIEIEYEEVKETPEIKRLNA